MFRGKCFSCGEPGHAAFDCPTGRKGILNTVREGVHRTSVAEVLYEYAWQGAMGIDAEESDDESAQVAEFEALFEADNGAKEEDKT